MLFYLDKILAKQGIAKCIAVSEKEISEKELEERKQCFNVKEVLIFEGIDIPHKFKYNEKLDTIEEVIEIVEDTPQTLSNEIEEIENEFDESVEIDPEKQYFYLDKAYADKFHKAQVIAVFPQPLKNPTEYFQREVYQHFGKDIPFYISIDDNVVREATEYEKYQRGQRKLSENEVVLKEEIIALEDGQYLDEEKQEIITVPCPEEYLSRKWNRNTHTWEDLTTDTQRVNKQYNEYMQLANTYDTELMKEEGVWENFRTFIDECRVYLTRIKKGVEVRSSIPMPSKNLEKFFENSFKEVDENV